MKLSQILPNLQLENPDLKIESLSFDSRLLQTGGLYFCLEGSSADGHAYAVEAAQNGAIAVVAHRVTDAKIPHILVPDTRAALGIAASRFYNEPAKKLKMIGITGTNGKTTTTYIVQNILQAAGKKVGVIGTTAILIGGRRLEAKLTTPDPIDFHSILATMVEEKIEYVVMEVSAHALALRKMEGVQFDVTAFTNFSRDHLDFFGDMDTYFAAKKQLFTPVLSKQCVLNADDEWVRGLIADCPIPYTTFGCNNPADVFSVNLSMGPDGLTYVLNLKDDLAEVKFNMPGKFNMYNTLCAAAISGALNIPLKSVVKGIRNVKKVDGRFQIINTSKCSIVVDFAHTDDGLTNILNTIREFAPKKIITVFGCGGDRDRTKRPVMGRIVSEMSDYCFITSDNPRRENPDSIINDIASGVSKQRQSFMQLVRDRREAIAKAVEFAGDGDVVLVAGKGAENYIEVGSDKIPYNDEEYIMSLIERQKL